MLAFPASCCVVTRGESLAARKRRTYAMHARSAGKSADLHARHVLEDGATNLPSNFHACAASFGYELSGPGLATCRLSQDPDKQHVPDLPETLCGPDVPGMEEPGGRSNTAATGNKSASARDQLSGCYAECYSAAGSPLPSLASAVGQTWPVELFGPRLQARCNAHPQGRSYVQARSDLVGGRSRPLAARFLEQNP